MWRLPCIIGGKNNKKTGADFAEKIIFAALKVFFMNNSNEHSIKDLAMQFVNRSGKQRLFAERTVIEKWPEYVGALCAGQTKCVSLTNGILRVKVPNAALRFELHGRKSMLLERINAGFSFPVVNDILFL